MNKDAPIGRMVKYRNKALKGQRQVATARGELKKYLGVSLAAVHKKCQGSVSQLFKTRGSSVSSSLSGSRTRRRRLFIFFASVYI